MKIDKKGHATIISDQQNDLQALLMKLTHEHKSFSGHNLIIDTSSSGSVRVKEVNAFLKLSKIHRAGKRSFVIVADVDFNKISDKLLVVPTITEAHDMIEMEEIERDLGF